MDFLRTVLEALKLSPRYFYAAALGCGLVLFASSDLIEQLGLSQLAQDYRAIFGVGVIVGVALGATQLASALFAKLRGWWSDRQFYRYMSERLQRLNEDEKQILRFYLAKQTRGNVLRLDDGVVQGLVACGIIYRSASLGSAIDGFAHNISDFAWNYLNEHPHLLDGMTNTYRTDRQPRWWEQ